MSPASIAHSVVEPSGRSKGIAGAVIVLYAAISMVPLVWIFLTAFKSPPDSIAYPPKIVFKPTNGAAVTKTKSIALKKKLAG